MEKQQTKYPVIEIFSSIQGEGIHTGRPVTFIRLAGCNLSCPWCDTKQSWNENYPKMTAKEIAAQVTTEMVVLTGGEPTIHDLTQLVYALHAKNCYIAIETNGTNPVPFTIDWVTVSPKPGSNFEIHPEINVGELKYVVDDNFDPKVIQASRVGHGLVWLQVESARKESMKRCFEMVMNDPSGKLRVGIQIHKLLEVR